MKTFLLATNDSAGGWLCVLAFILLGVAAYARKLKKEQAQIYSQPHYAPQRPSLVRNIVTSAGSSLLLAIVKSCFGMGGHHGHHRHRH